MVGGKSVACGLHEGTASGTALYWPIEPRFCCGELLTSLAFLLAELFSVDLRGLRSVLVTLAACDKTSRVVSVVVVVFVAVLRLESARFSYLFS